MGVRRGQGQIHARQVCMYRSPRLEGQTLEVSGAHKALATWGYVPALHESDCELSRLPYQLYSLLLDTAFMKVAGLLKRAFHGLSFTIPGKAVMGAGCSPFMLILLAS